MFALGTYHLIVPPVPETWIRKAMSIEELWQSHAQMRRDRLFHEKNLLHNIHTSEGSAGLEGCFGALSTGA